MARKPKLRVFLDTNVIVSGLLSPGGAPAQILDSFVDGMLTVVISRQVLEELAHTTKIKFPSLLPALMAFLENTKLEIIHDPGYEEVKRLAHVINLDDAVILVAALNSRPDYFVTGDKHFFSNSISPLNTGLKIVTPSQFLLEQDPG
jgi:uncharacterized protein